MIKTIVKAQAGLEEEFEFISARKANLESEKEAAIKEAIAEVEERFRATSEKLDSIFRQVSETEEIEVPDEFVDEEAEVQPSEEVVEQSEVPNAVTLY